MQFCPEKDGRSSVRIPQAFCFHYGGKQFKGVNLSAGGFAIQIEVVSDRTFEFSRSQLIQNCHVEIEGCTIYFSKVRVCWLDVTLKGFVFGLQIESMVEPEQEKYLTLYEGAIQAYQHSGRLSLSDQKIMEELSR